MFKKFLIALAMTFVGMAGTASADILPYSKMAYHMPSGGAQPSLAAVAADPLNFYGSQERYDNARAIIEKQIARVAPWSYYGRNLTDQKFRQMLRDRGAEVDCNQHFMKVVGFDTQLRDGTLVPRDCVSGEKIAVVKLGLFRQHTVRIFLMGCLNPLVDEPALTAVIAVSTTKHKKSKPKCVGAKCDQEPPTCIGEKCDEEPPACEGERCEPPACEGERCEPPQCEGEKCEPKKPPVVEEPKCEKRKGGECKVDAGRGNGSELDESGEDRDPGRSEEVNQGGD